MHISIDSLISIIAGLMEELNPDAARHRPITLDSRLDRDLGLDSLVRMELFSRLEKEFGLRLPEKVLMAAETPRDILRCLNRETAEPVKAALNKDAKKDEISDRREEGLAGAKTLLDVLEQHIGVQPDALHLTLLEEEEEFRVSYRMLRHEALKVAARLIRLDLEPKEPVAIMLPTSLDYFYSFFGILYAGGIPVPLYPPARAT